MTDQPSSNKSIRESVLSAIETGKIKMRPKWVYVLRTTLMLLGIVLASLALLYIVSFGVFLLRQNGEWFVPAFGTAGVLEFLTSLPWVFVLLAVAFVALLEILVRRYSFAYRRPLLYSVVVITAIVAAGGVIISRLGFHEGLLEMAEQHRLPVAGQLYRQYGMKGSDNVTAGVIKGRTDKGFMLIDRHGKSITVVVNPGTRFPLGTDFADGDLVVVFGTRDDGTITAQGVREIEGAEPSPQQPPSGPGWHIRFSE